MSITIETLSPTPSAADLASLNHLLRDAVEGGASVGFLLPISDTEIVGFWRDVFTDVRLGNRIVIAARNSDRLVGTVQLALAGKPNSRHRAELQKLLVMRAHRGRGLGSALMQAAEASARAHARTLLVLDTSATGNALGVYQRCGYTRAGAIPGYARDPDGPLIDTVFYYKQLPAIPLNPQESRVVTTTVTNE
jgi:acetyltransferase